MNQHEIINNTLRLEVLGQLLLESLETGSQLSNEDHDNYISFLKKQIELLNLKD